MHSYSVTDAPDPLNCHKSVDSFDTCCSAVPLTWVCLLWMESQTQLQYHRGPFLIKEAHKKEKRMIQILREREREAHIL